MKPTAQAIITAAGIGGVVGLYALGAALWLALLATLAVMCFAIVMFGDQ